MMSFTTNGTGVRVGGRVYRLRQRGLRGFLRPGSGRDTVCKEARGDRIYLLGLCRGRVLILQIVVSDYYQNCHIPDYENPCCCDLLGLCCDCAQAVDRPRGPSDAIL